jgi:spermidine/putrescine transport system permease protein
MLPELVLSLALLSWFSVLHWELSLVTVVIAHVTLVLPFAILVIAARLTSMDASIEDAARDLGAGEWQVLSKITLPLLKPAIISAFTLSFLLSFDDFLVTYYTNGAGGDTLPVKLYALMKSGLTPKIQALSSLMLVFSIALVVILVKFRPKDGSAE